MGKGMQALASLIRGLDNRTLVAVLYWGNLMACLMVFSYRVFVSMIHDRRLLRRLAYAKVFQAAAWFLLFFRGSIPDLLSVNIGNSLLFIGFFSEAMATLDIMKTNNKWLYFSETLLLILAIVFFNIAESWHVVGIRVATASIAVFLLLFLPSLLLVFANGNSRFKRTTGILYFVFLILQLPRAVDGMYKNYDLFAPGLVQSMTFLALVAMLIYGLMMDLLLIKEDSDKELYTIATTDHLTRLSNRFNFMDRAEGLFSQHLRLQQVLAVLFLDIDHFKVVNDQFGHSTGDEVLTHLGTMIAASLRKGDLTCRYGGEEFLVLLPWVSVGAVKIIVDRLMTGARSIRLDAHPQFKMTVSIGVVFGMPQHGETLETFIHSADAALYEAKNTGRDRSVFRSMG
jgi:diguanylate cyclase (GGDEF)-like protein